MYRWYNFRCWSCCTSCRCQVSFIFIFYNKKTTLQFFNKNKINRWTEWDRKTPPAEKKLIILSELWSFNAISNQRIDDERKNEKSLNNWKHVHGVNLSPHCHGETFIFWKTCVGCKSDFQSNLCTIPWKIHKIHLTFHRR